MLNTNTQVEWPTYRDTASEEEGHEQIERFIHQSKRDEGMLLVPSRVRREQVRAFLDRTVTPDVPYQVARRAAELARFYVLPDVLPRFEALLRGRETQRKDVLRSTACLELKSELGSEAQQAEVAKYYDYLLSHRLFPEVIAPLIDAFFLMPEPVTEEAIARRLEHHIRQLQRDPEAEDGEAPRQAEEHLGSTLPIVAEARKARQRIVSQSDPQRRATGLARAYIGLEDDDAADWGSWSAYRLMGELEQQGPETVLHGLNQAAGQIEDNEDPAFADYARGRAARAIVFFGGRLTDEQQGWLAADKIPGQLLEG